MSLIWFSQCEYEKNCSLRDIAPDLDGCSGHSKLHHRYAEEKERLIKEAEEKEKATSLRYKEVLEQLKPGDKVEFVGSPKSYYGCTNIPQYVGGSVLTVLGFTRNGNIKCDYDGGKPFNIPPVCLRIIKDEGYENKHQIHEWS